MPDPIPQPEHSLNMDPEDFDVHLSALGDILRADNLSALDQSLLTEQITLLFSDPDYHMFVNYSVFCDADNIRHRMHHISGGEETVELAREWFDRGFVEGVASQQQSQADLRALEVLTRPDGPSCWAHLLEPFC